MTIHKPDKPFTLEMCKQYVAERIFLLSPPQYKKKYPIWPGGVGLEVEMFPFDRSNPAIEPPKLLPLFTSEKNLSKYLIEIAQQEDWQLEYLGDHPTIGGLIKVVLQHKDALTFEPGGQLEFSSLPYPCLKDAINRVEQVQGVLNAFFSPRQIEFLQIGSHPWQSVDDVGLQMTKPRYQAMNRFFQDIGPWGQRMMRLSTGIQVNLDYGHSEELLAKRYLAAQMLAPITYATFAYSPFDQGQLTPFKSIRGQSWRKLDPSRTGFPKLKPILNHIHRDSCIDSYLDFVLDAKVVYIESLEHHNPVPSLTLRQWITHGYQGSKPTIRDFETHLSLLFPEVRPRGFLELRSIDGLPPVWQFVPAAYCCGLLYNEKNVDRCIELLAKHSDSLDELLVKSVYGLEDRTLRDLSVEMMTLAIEGFGSLPSCFRKEKECYRMKVFAERFTFLGRTPADDIAKAYLNSGTKKLSYETIRAMEHTWMDLLNHS